MGKLEFDKYYTPLEIAEHCYNKAIEVIGRENISEIIEPSAGQGVFLDIDSKIIGYDIKPDDLRIKEQDYIELDIEYKKGRLILGNPPYGRCLNMAQKFFKKSIDIADYIAFILPISQLNNNRTFYEFDLVYSEDLGEKFYSGIALHCAFNIYKRPENGLNKKEKNILKSVKIYRQDKPNYDSLFYDVRMCYWGNATMGKILNEKEHYSAEYKIVILDIENKDKIVKFIKSFDWNNYSKNIAMKHLCQYHIIEVLKKEFPNLK